MLKRMKRLICLLTVLCMVASMAGFTAFAEGEDNVIREVTFAGELPNIKEGDALPAADESGMERVTGISCPALEENYELDAYWLKDGSSDVTDTVFEKAKYQLYINLRPKEENEGAATFAEDIVINGLGDRKWNTYCSNQLSVFVEYDLRDKIDQPEVSNFPLTIEDGDSTELGIAIPADALYTLETVLKRSTTNGTEEYTEDVFVPGYYQLTVILTPKAGCYFTDTVEGALLVNGAVAVENNSIGVSRGWVEGAQEPSLFIHINYSVVGEPITEVSVTGIPTAEKGKAADVSGIKVPENANYTLDAYWWDCETDEEFTGTFGNGSYDLWLQFCPKDGYTFAQNCQMIVDGEVQEEINYYDAYEINQYFNTDLREVITKVEFTGIPTAEVGKNADASDVKIPENANYYLTAEWIDPETAEPVTGTFEKQQYVLAVNLTAKDGTRFADDVQVFVDGVEVDNFSQPEQDVIYYSVWADLRENVTLVEVNNIPADLTVGEKLPTPDVKVPENAKYKIVEQTWTKSSGEVTDSVEKDAYTLRIIVEVDSGAFINGSTTVYANDKLLLRQDTALYENGWYYYVNDQNTLIIEKSYDTRDVIDTVAVTGAPEMKVGASLKTDGVKIPENVNYELDDAYFTRGEGDETFQAGRKYTFVVRLVVKEGYRFSEDLLATLDGGYWDSVEVGFNEVYLCKNCAFAAESAENVITKVELTGVPTLELGKEIDVSKVAIPENANYEIWDAEVTDYENGDLATKLEEGHKYILNVRLQTKDEYAFAEEVEIYVNGQYVGKKETSNGWYLNYSVIANFKKASGDIKLTGATDAKVGAAPVTTGVTAEGTIAKVTEVRWEKWDYNRAQYVDFEGVFEAGNVYRRLIYFAIPETYQLDGGVYVNGVFVNSVYQESWYEYAVETEFSLENKLITSVDLLITPPEVGRPFNSKNIQVSAGAHCYIEYKEWNEYTDDENGYWSNVFDKETMYISFLVLTPEAGYVFADDVVITVNGKNADVEYGMTYIILEAGAFFDTTVREAGTVVVRDDKIDNLLGAAAEDATEIVLNLSGMAQPSVKVNFPANDLGDLVEEEMALTIVTDTATVTLDTKTLETIVKAAGEESVVTLEVKYIEQNVLTTEQQAALKDKKVSGVISAELLLDGKYFGDFGGGTVTIQIPYTIAEGTVADGYALWYLADDGSFTEQKATFADNKITTVMAHFSEYVVLYTEPTPPAANPSTGDEFPVAAFAAIAILSVLGMAVVITAKKRSVR